MIIKKFYAQEGLIENTDTFSEKRNLIYSKTNTKGKSTYVRLLFYALGYPIPDMRGIKFARISTEVVVKEKRKEYRILRTNNSLTVFCGKDRADFQLPSEHTSFLSYIYKYDNIKVLENIIGFMYVDQDKGWTLLNRGKVIGKIQFCIEDLLAGLNNNDKIDELLAKKKRLEFNKEKYSAMLNMQELSEQVHENNGELYISEYEKELGDKIAYCKLKIENENKTLKEINSVINREKQFLKFIDSMQLSVSKDNITIPVNRKTLVNFESNYKNFEVYKSIIITNIEKLKREKAVYQEKLNDYYNENVELSLFEDEHQNKLVEKQIANFNIDQNMVENLLDKTKDDLSLVNTKIRESIKMDNHYINKIHEYVLKYAKILNVDDKTVEKEDYIFTRDLRSLSGAVLQKTIFAFKIAFLKVIEESMGTKLFIVLDSPKGKELDDDNVKLMENLVKKELKGNQVFLVSIYDLENEKKIEIKERAIEGRND